MLCLGIESTAHTFGMSIVDCNGKIWSNKNKLFSTETGGLIPAELSDHHTDIFDKLLCEVLFESGKKLNDIDIIAFSQSPGMGHSLRIGAIVARSLALLLDVPLIGVNHCIAHLEVGRKFAKNELDINDICNDPILLYASGANTQIIGYEGKKYRIFGETLDNGIGNFLDGFARYIGLGFPGGPKIQLLAENYQKEKQEAQLIELPYAVKGMDLSFGGIQTNLKKLFDSNKYSKEELCFAVQENSFAMLIEVAERALAHTGKKELLLGGGVACNKRLQEMAKKMCKDRGAKCFILPNELNVDNAAMIAWTGMIQYAGYSMEETECRKQNAAGRKQCAGNSVQDAKRGNRTQQLKIQNSKDISNSHIYPYLRTDEVEITWRN